MKGLDLLEENKPSNGLVIDEKGKVTLPEGYLWCMECKAATPHTKCSYSFKCEICGERKYNSSSCPNCGWEPEEELKLREMYVVRHLDNCPEGEAIRRWEERSKKLGFYANSSKPLIRKIRVPRGEIEYVVDKLKCDCPFDTIYPCLNVFNYSSWRPYDMDCTGAVEWSYNVRCPICGEVFEIQDGNC